MTTNLTIDAARERIDELTVVDVRTPGEFASGHLPGAHNIPVDDLDEALPALREAAARRPLLVVCASGNRSVNACAILAKNGIAALSLDGGTSGWAASGAGLRRPAGAPAKTVWAMDRQVRFTAGGLVLLGLLLGLLVHPAFQLLSAGVAAGLVYSAVSNTCAMAAMLGKLPHNRTDRTDLRATLAAIRQG
ncbi:Inner membrane protein YgaP [Streptomyces sp. RB5]|uniref:Inner membrane protein YgaP n=1 Tax=Streptomyces smaragdinus TaxID=2585196 RepID=A0A7K0CGU4_9ACTN|nr:rhodanese-like domain-containing protein [Streptomyces smaragdinus]MQY12697.1 Inner membrane protein YgaP [Streptomyces smaragdinus]